MSSSTFVFTWSESPLGTLALATWAIACSSGFVSLI